MRYVSEDHDITGMPAVTCSKYKETFDIDTDYLVHYHERHAKVSPD